MLRYRVGNFFVRVMLITAVFHNRWLRTSTIHISINSEVCLIRLQNHKNYEDNEKKKFNKANKSQNAHINPLVPLKV